MQSSHVNPLFQHKMRSVANPSLYVKKMQTSSARLLTTSIFFQVIWTLELRRSFAWAERSAVAPSATSIWVSERAPS